MIHLTQKEKADRFDALQAAFKHTRAKYQSCVIIKGVKGEDPDILSAYNRGASDTAKLFVEDLERWIV